MPHWVPYLGLAVLPLLVICVGNPLSFAWGLQQGRKHGFKRGNEPMPPEYALRVSRSNRYLVSVRDTLLLLVVLRLATRQSLGLSQIGFSLHGWQWSLLIGIGASLLQTGLRCFLVRLVPPGKRRLRSDETLRQWSGAYWISTNLLSVLAEEVWIAFCVVALKHTGHSTVLSLILVAAAFGAAHFQYGFFGSLPTALWGSVSASLFLWRGSLLPSYLFHYIGNMLTKFYFARHTAREPVSRDLPAPNPPISGS